MRALNVPYQWGFPACLKGKRDGRSAVLRFHEDLPDFCSKLDIPPPALPGWEENNGIVVPFSNMQWIRSRGRGGGVKCDYCPHSGRSEGKRGEKKRKKRKGH